ncbi:RNA-binding protein [Rhodobacterales bacterium 52_120_T64]|nr:RNA-binding protein [Rhodobacterales bacterium 52_120_T64]
MVHKSDGKPIKGKGFVPAKRRSRGFLQTGGLLSKRIRQVGESRGFAETRLLTHWAEIVGQTMAAIAQPVKVSYAREGFGATLTVLTDGARAPELQMMLPELKEKVNACYGYSAISRIRITQTAEAGFSEQAAAFTHKPVAPKNLSDSQAAELSVSLAPIGDEKLRAALENLAKNVLTK